VPAIVTRLRDVGEERLKAMDADGIDVQVSRTPRLDPENFRRRGG